MPSSEYVTWTQREAARIHIKLAEKWGEPLPERVFRIADSPVSNPLPVSYDSELRPYRVPPEPGSPPDEPGTYVGWRQREAARIHIRLAEKWGEPLPERVFRLAAAVRERQAADGVPGAAAPASHAARTGEVQNSDS
ncbi:MAG TPA: hypothetical protein VMB79_16435 [Jatrophihabitans sp.]|nr:hypothetical protein [Jatrophihabitans sp.]